MKNAFKICHNTPVELVIQVTYFTSQHGKDWVIVVQWKVMQILTKNDDETRHTKPGSAY